MTGRRRASGPRWRKSAAFLTLVLLSGWWSGNAIAEPGEQESSTNTPGVSAVPDGIFNQAASVAMPGGPQGGSLQIEGSRNLRNGAGSAIGGPNGIPATALLAYKRAAQILNAADPACNVDWSLIAAIGRVESDHGRFGGNALDKQGTAQPGIYGVPLNGNGVARILDSDAGALDNDAVYDRAVGPMQFIPSTWRIAGVDADQDGEANPQNIYDAATATAVYLCAGDEDLSTDSGARKAVYRYNHSERYVDLVLAIAAAYATGDFAAVPDGTPSAISLSPATPADLRAAGKKKSGSKNGGSNSGSGPNVEPGRDGGNGNGGGNNNGDGGDPVVTPPNDGGGNGGGGNNGGGDGGDGGDGGGNPVGDVVDDVTKPVQDTIVDASEAVSKCTNKLSGTLSGDALDQAVAACADAITGKTNQEANNFLSQSVAAILNQLGLGCLLGLLC